MTQEEKWINRYNEVVTFIESNKEQGTGEQYLFHE